MAELALVLWRSTGSSGFNGLGGRSGSAEWFAGVLFAVALVMGVAAPVLALADALESIGALEGAGSVLSGSW